jgi:hypothetical protein
MTWKAPEPVNEPINKYLAKLQGIAPRLEKIEIVPDNWGVVYEAESVYGVKQVQNSDGFSIPSPGETGT